MEKREPSYTVGRNVNWYNHYGKQYVWRNHTYIQRKPYFEKMHAPPCSLQHYLQSPRYGMAKCPLTEEWIKKMWHVYTMEYYSAIKKNEIMPFAATWMDLEIIILSEASQTKTNI